MKSSDAFFKATLFESKDDAPPRVVELIVRAKSYDEAEQLADRIGGEYLSGFLIESAPTQLPPLESRTRNGVMYLVQRRVPR